MTNSMKGQSAMEYLMTYGWSILIIAIVLAALFSLGVFGNSNLGPRAQPNSCRVYRPNGPGTTTNINLQGVCNGELPQYVTQFLGSAGGATSHVNVGVSQFPTGSSARSLFAWVYYTGGTTDEDVIFGYGLSGALTTNSGAILAIGGGSSVLRFVAASNDYQSGLVVSPNTWNFVGYTYSAGSSSITMWVNGQSQTGGLSGGAPLATSAAAATIGNFTGMGVGYWGPYKGSMANVQLYSAALDANAVLALYYEGIGGAPIEPQNLVGWWPLNGDTSDYGGNGNVGTPTNVIFTSTWSTGYTAP